MGFEIWDFLIVQAKLFNSTLAYNMALGLNFFPANILSKHMAWAILNPSSTLSRNWLAMTDTLI